jgi:hypothetical protein
MKPSRLNPGDVQAHQEVLQAHPGALHIHPGALQGHPGAMEAHSGVLETHHGTVECGGLQYAMKEFLIVSAPSLLRA